MQVKFQGILVASVTAYCYDSESRTLSLEAGGDYQIPEGMEPVSELHITLLSSELDKEARKIMKQRFAERSQDLLPFPAITFSHAAYLADSGKKQSVVVNVNEQDKVRQWVIGCLALMGIAADAYFRVYHVSIANPTGSKFDSVPDPWRYRKG